MIDAKTGELIKNECKEQSSTEESEAMPYTQRLKESFDAGWQYRLNYEQFCYEASLDGVTWELIKNAA